MLKRIKKFNNFTWTVIPFAILSLNVSASDIFLDEMCSSNYKRLANSSLQFLYQLDGNLDNVNASKRKRIAYLDGVFKSDDKPQETRRQAYNELFLDPDYWKTGVKNQAQDLIVGFENLIESQGWDSFKKKVNNNQMYFTYNDMQDVDWLYSEARNFLEHLSITDKELEILGYDQYFENATGMDALRFALSKASLSSSLTGIKSCQMAYLQYDLLNN